MFSALRAFTYTVNRLEIFPSAMTVYNKLYVAIQDNLVCFADQFYTEITYIIYIS